MSQLTIEGYVPITKSFIKGRDAKNIVTAKALNDAPKDNLVNGRKVQSGDYILVDTSEKDIVDGQMYLTENGELLELVKVFKTEQGYEFHRTRDSFIHADDNPEQFIIGKAFEVIKKHRKEN